MERADIAAHARRIRLAAVNILAWGAHALMVWRRRDRLNVWLTLRRHLQIYLFPGRTRRHLQAHRKGTCNRCGVCCRLIRRCPYLQPDNSCGIYPCRNAICHYFPVSQADVDLIAAVDARCRCDYHFE